MNCEKLHLLYEQFVFESLDESVAGEIEEHLGYCEHCQEWHLGQTSIGEALRLSADSHLPRAEYFEGLLQRTGTQLTRPAWSGGASVVLSHAWRKFIDSRLTSFRIARHVAVGAVCLAAGIAFGPRMLDAIDRAMTEFFPNNGHEMSAKEIERAANEFYTSPLSGGPGGLRSVSLRHSNSDTPNQYAAKSPLFEPGNGKANPEAVRALINVSIPGAEAGLGTIKSRIDEYLNRYSEPEDPGNPSAEIQGRLFREARAALAEGDYLLCQTKFLEAYNTRPESRFGSRALFELGSLHFEIKRNFPAAHEFYRECQKYSAAYLGRTASALLMERVELLNQYEEDDYAPLKLFYLAADSESAESAAGYLELIAKYPTCPLIAPAIEALAKTAAGADTRSFPGDEAALSLRALVREQARSPLAAKAQMALADIERDYFRNYYRATQEYRKVLRMRSASADLKTRAQSQIDQNRWRAGSPQGAN